MFGPSEITERLLVLTCAECREAAIEWLDPPGASKAFGGVRREREMFVLGRAVSLELGIDPPAWSLRVVWDLRVFEEIKRRSTRHPASAMCINDEELLRLVGLFDAESEGRR